MAKKIAVEYRIYDGPDALAHAAAEHFLELAQKAVAARGKARIAVSGGSTPKRTFELLASPQEKFLNAMPWDKLELFFVDERTVPPDDKDSNYRMTREAMLEKVPLKPEQVFRIEGELPPEEAAARYESTIRNQFKLEGAETPRFDILQLGMGDDGHTASIFPHTDAIHQLAHIAYANQVPQKDTWRVTLTWPVIVEASEVFFLIGGTDKADPLHRVLQGPYDPETLPSQLIQPKTGKLLFLLDKAAAAELPAPDASGIGKLGDNSMILAGDVGGTKVHLALYDFDKGELTHVRDEKFPAQEYSGLEVIVRTFLEKNSTSDVTAACFGVPGPVRHGRLKLTNLPWILDSAELSKNLGIPHIFLINDLEANGYGISELHSDQIYVLSEGDASAVGNRGLVSAGTGLGEAILVWNGKTHVPMASEGGHCDFAPRNDIEIDLLRYLQKTYRGRVSFERVVSGIGLKNVYSFLRDDKGLEEPAWLKERMQHEDPNAVIGELGEDGSNELCAKALDIFVSSYGAEAGNLALKVLSTGGLYLGGGIAPKILRKMKDGAFMKSFTDKGRLSDLLVQMPVRIILESRAALMGAAAYAEARAAEISGQSVRAASVQFS